MGLLSGLCLLFPSFSSFYNEFPQQANVVARINFTGTVGSKQWQYQKSENRSCNLQTEIVS